VTNRDIKYNCVHKKSKSVPLKYNLIYMDKENIQKNDILGTQISLIHCPYYNNYSSWQVVERNNVKRVKI